MRKLWVGLLIGVLGLGGCSSDATEKTPLSSKTQGLLGDWRLAFADVDPEEFEFSYSFARSGTFSNRAGGSFLKRIEELNEIEGIDIDIGRLDAVDGGFLVFRGTWSEDGDRLDLGFETLEIEVFGTVPIAGRISLPVHEEQLAGDNRLSYSCRVDGERLTLNGESLTLGAGSGEMAGLDPLAAEVLRMVADFALMQASVRAEDQFTLIKAD